MSLARCHYPLVMRASLLLLVVLLAAPLLVSAGAVRALTPDDFDSVVDGSTAAFVEFYAPWCGHCKHLEPEYEKVGEAFAGSPNIIVAKVDADAHRDLGGRFGVTGFPTLKFFPKGWKKGDTPETYNGGRTFDDIANYISDKSGAKYKKAKATPSAVVDLNAKNFNEIVMDPSKNVLVEFYAPWCGHCKHLAPVYEKLGAAYRNEKDVVIAKIDADNAANKELSSKYGVTGFPTLKFFPKGTAAKTAEDYNGGRELDAFVKFINEKCGTSRTPSGGLGETAGRVAELDALAKGFATGDHKALLAQAKSAAAALEGDAAKHAALYVRVMEKVSAEGAAYVTNESARLQKLIDSPSTASAKVDEFIVRRNILQAFA